LLDPAPSCSPKSVYSLAKLVSLEELVVLSYERIKHNISVSNVVPELFSSFTASNSEILNMESELLFRYDETNKTSREIQEQKIQEHIQAMASGKAVFQAKTLAFVYQGLITKKRRAIREPAKVHCARYRDTHVFAISELLEGLYCPSCHDCGKNGRGEYGRPFTRCGHCNGLRDEENTRCSRCNSLFKSN